MVKVEYPRFLIFDLLGALLWTTGYATVGFLFSKQLDRVAADAHLLGGGFLVLFADRSRCLRALSLARTANVFIEQVKGDRITPDELKHQLESGERPVIIDLRHPLDVLTDPQNFAWGACRYRLKICKSGTMKSAAMARLFFSVLDQTKPPAPVWRCN